jgi:hypothetical protein
MKKYFILLFATLALNVNAQNDKCCETPECKKTEAGNVHMGKNPKAMLWKSVKEEDKEAFKALMKEYHAERKAVIEKNRGKKLEKGQKPTEEQMDAFMKQGYAKRKALLDLEEKYYGKFRKFLAPWQAAQAVKVDGFNGQRNNHKAFRGGNHGKKHQYGNKHHDAKCGAKCDACPKKQECADKKDCPKKQECEAKKDCPKKQECDAKK